MTDIRNMSEDELTQLNQGNRRPTGIIKMSETKLAPTKLKKTKTDKPKAPPAYSFLEDATEEEIQEVLNATRYVSEFTSKLRDLPVGGGFRAVGGDIVRLKQMNAARGKTLGSKFKAREINGNVIIVREV
jgi:hypothetical protein